MSLNSINRVMLVGVLGKDPEVKMMSNGKKVAKFSVATNTSYVNTTTGEKKEGVDWHNIVVYSEVSVKFIEHYIKKASKVLVEGAIKTRKYQDKAGGERYITEVVVSGFDSRVICFDYKSSDYKSSDYKSSNSTADTTFAYHKESQANMEEVDMGIIPF